MLSFSNVQTSSVYDIFKFIQVIFIRILSKIFHARSGNAKLTLKYVFAKFGFQRTKCMKYDKYKLKMFKILINSPKLRNMHLYNQNITLYS